MTGTFRTTIESNLINKSKIVNFIFNGDSYQGFEGATLNFPSNPMIFNDDFILELTFTPDVEENLEFALNMQPEHE